VKSKVLKCVTVIGTFEEPAVQIIFKQILSRPENKDLLLKYEASLPSWTIVFAQYTSLYRPWQRKVVRLITFFASLITVSIGFYDLYKHFPMFSEILNESIGGWVLWFEQIIALRVGFIISSLLYFSEPFQSWFNILFGVEQWSFLERLFFPVIYCLSMLRGIITLIYDLFLPVFALVYLIVSSGFMLVFTVITLPFTIAYTVIYCFVYQINSLFNFTTTLRDSWTTANKVVKPLTQKENVETTVSILQYATELSVSWSQSIHKRVIQSSKSVYDFIVYCGCEIGRHNYTLRQTLWQKACDYYASLRTFLRPHKSVIDHVIESQ
jgi:hypothetical protein